MVENTAINVHIAQARTLDIEGKKLKIRLVAAFVEPDENSDGKTLCMLHAEDYETGTVELGEGCYTLFSDLKIDQVHEMKDIAKQLFDSFFIRVKADIITKMTEEKIELELMEQQLASIEKKG